MHRLHRFVLQDASIAESGSRGRTPTVLDRRSLVLRDQLALALQPLGVPPMEASEFATWALQCLCQNGSPTGVALRPTQMNTARKRRPGQSRRVRPGILLPHRTVRPEPILCTVTRCLAKEAVRRDPALKTELPLLEKVLGIWADELDHLSQQPKMALLQQRPLPHRNRMLELHLETCGYPAYEPFGAPMHLGFVARIEQQSKVSSSKRRHNLRTYLTAPKAIIPVFPAALVKPTLADYGTPEQFASLLSGVVRSLVGIKRVTRLDYVAKFLHLVYSCARDQQAVERAKEHLKKLQRPSRTLPAEVDQEPEEHLSELPSHEGWLKICGVTTRESEIAALPLPEDVLDSPNPAAGMLALTELPDQSEKLARRLARFARHRLVQDRCLDEAAPGVLSLDDLAMYLACVQGETVSCDLNRAARCVFLGLLIATGQPAERLAGIVVGGQPGAPLRGLNPVYDPACGTLSIAPSCYVYLPDGLQPPSCKGRVDPESARHWRGQWQEQRVAYTATTPVHEILLPPPVRGDVERLLEMRERALLRHRCEENTEAGPDSGPLFLLMSEGDLRAWSSRDTNALIRKLNSFASRWHPDWPPIRASQFQRTAFHRYVARYGLDPVYAWFITDYTIHFLEMPLRYSLVHADNLNKAYWQAFRKLQVDLIETYRIAWDGRFPLVTSLCNPDWDEEDLPTSDLCFGTPHHPKPEILARLFHGLMQLCRDENPRIAHNAQVTLVLLLLTISAGIRPTEQTSTLEGWIDLEGETYSVRGKSNFDHESYRRLGLPSECMPLLMRVLRECRLMANSDAFRPAFWMFEQDEPVPARSDLIKACLLEAGRRAGLADDQIPSHHSMRHFFRSFALARIPFDAVNALMGHQSTGRERFNPFLPHPLADCANLESNPTSDPLLETGRRLASQILGRLEIHQEELEALIDGKWSG
jgi:integrase